MQWLIYVGILWIGMIVGVFIEYKLLFNYNDFSGTIFVYKDEPTGKIVYSLELEDLPENLSLQKLVIFKVDASERTLDRNLNIAYNETLSKEQDDF